MIQKEKAKNPSEDLEMEIIDWAGKFNPVIREEIQSTAYHFANWQKGQMMKEAVEGAYNNSDWGVPCIDLPMPLDLERFDKVKIIIVKED